MRRNGRIREHVELKPSSWRNRGAREAQGMELAYSQSSPVALETPALFEFIDFGWPPGCFSLRILAGALVNRDSTELGDRRRRPPNGVRNRRSTVSLSKLSDVAHMSGQPGGVGCEGASGGSGASAAVKPI